MLIVAGGAAYYYFVQRSKSRVPAEVAYVLPASLTVVDTPAQIRIPVGTLKSGEQVEVLGRARNWVQIRLPGGRTGWVEAASLIDAQTYEGGQRLLKELAALPPQAVGHTGNVANLRVEPSRDAPQLAQLPEKQRVEVFGRRLVEHPAEPGQAPTGPRVQDAWYLVRADSRAGWVLGRFVALDIPEAISMYAQEVNLVAWLVLDTVDDNGRQMPQYLVADRVGTQECDFNHIRVFTWWKKRQEYVTAYVESNVNGYFPLKVARINNVSYFRLRLVDEDGNKFQKVYGLFDTITRPIGIVEGWESDAMPTQHARKTRRVAAPRGHHR